MNCKLVLSVVLFCLVLSSPSWALMEPDLARRLELLDAGAMLPVQVVLKEQFDNRLLVALVEGLPRPVRRARVGRLLEDFARASQRDLLAWLESERTAGRVTDVRPLWLVNAVGFFATREVILAVDERPEVELVYYGRLPARLAPVELNEPAPGDATASIQPNLVVVNARGAWAQGATGQGVVVGVVDTGVRYTHEDLRNHLWTSEAYPNCGFNFASKQYSSGHPGPSDYDTLTPLDYYGHGTHVAGIVGADGSYGNNARDTMGVAPSARIMAVAVDVYLHTPYPDTSMEQNIIAGMQFCIRPSRDTLNGADVITMSLGLIVSWTPRYAVWRRAEENVLAANIAHLVAAGNEGSTANAITTPGNCPPPWSHPANHPTSNAKTAVITVGATNNTDQAATFSSRGPTRTWGAVPPWNDYTYPPGLMDPDICAPGYSILSTSRMTDRSYTSMSGTSMATPCAAGCVALMLSKNPYLTPWEIDSILERHATKDLGPAGKDSIFGSGRIDCGLAITHTPPPGPRHDVALDRILAPGAKVDPGIAFSPVVAVRNRGTFREPNVAVHCRIDSLGVPVYNGTRTIVLLDSARVDTVTLPAWNTGPGGQPYDLTFWHSYSPDTNRANDTLRTRTMTRGHDIRTARTNLLAEVRAG